MNIMRFLINNDQLCGYNQSVKNQVLELVEQSGKFRK